MRLITFLIGRVCVPSLHYSFSSLDELREFLGWLLL